MVLGAALVVFFPNYLKYRRTKHLSRGRAWRKEPKIHFTLFVIVNFPKHAPLAVWNVRVRQKEGIRDYEGLKDFLGPKDRICFVDGMHPYHNAMPARGWIEKGSNKEIPTNTGRERMNLNGVLCLNTPDGPEIIVREEERINGPAMVELLKEIEGKNPEAERIVLILDNAPYNRSKRVKEYLETSKVEVWYLPPYSPNLNLIERLWKFLTAK